MQEDSTNFCPYCREPKPIASFVKKNRRCLECRREASRQWKERNRERNRELSRASYHKHADKLNQQKRELYWSDPEKARAQQRIKDANRPPGYFREYHWRNHEKRLEQIGKSERKRRALKAGAPGDGATLNELIGVHGYLCYLCNVAIATEVEHVIPLSRGGSNYPENLRPACKSCNSRKGNKILK